MTEIVSDHSHHHSEWHHYNYDVVHFILSFLYLILALFCLYSFLKKLRQQNNSNQQIFYPLLFVGVLIRAVFMFLQPFVMEDELQLPNQANFILNSLPSFLFFTIYLIVLFIWVEIYLITYGATTTTIRRLPIIFNSLVVTMFAALAVLYILDFTLYPLKYDSISAEITKPEIIIALYDCCCFITASGFFFFFGIRLVFKFRKQQKTLTEEKRHIIVKRITGLTILIVLCFLIRASITLYSIFIMNFISGQWWWFDGAYFFTLEIVPLWIMLYLLTMDKNRRIKSHDYSGGSSEHSSLINSS
ncbi:hypothetical protein DLAC_07098 [Tieghemostelium lacteum]|uniref:THH1/TOM1/TOM3 domain-containing protein n=1 Tax=Tieghemostelium lacteum TaxID=361077 RepID=A0A151ZE78_TIELA|nr:hypothetical protein DLAC_07098 [Tieghemostelium lacteum]|eukprot:KYQ92251.1 hypothetical protein DLAC_07098 [Tieghemostelium lacteum]